ncbi:hypothetical protein ACMFMF_005282 [Clarireedia jacksonii]
MILNSLPLIVATTGLCHASLISAVIRQRADPSQISSTSTPLVTSTSSPAPEHLTPSPSVNPRALVPDFVGNLLTGSSSAPASDASVAAANASAQILSVSTAAAGSISAIQVSASSAIASASADAASIRASAAAALDAASSSLAFISSSASVQISSVSAELSSISASLTSAAAIATYSAQAAALALGAEASESAYSQVADARKAVYVSTATTLPLTIAVILIIGISFVSSLLSVLAYRFVSRRKLAGKMGQKGTGEAIEKYPGGAAATSTSNSAPATSPFYGAGQDQGQSADVSTSSYHATAGMKTGLEKGSVEFTTKEVDSLEEADSRYSIDIEKEMTEIHQASWDHRKMESRRGKEEGRRVSDLSRSSKSISALFAPRGVPIKLFEDRKSKMLEMRARAIEENNDDEGLEVVFAIDNGEANPHAKTFDTKHKEEEEKNAVLQFTLSPSVYSRPESGSSSSKSGQQSAKSRDKGKEKGVGVGKFRFSIGKAL